MKNAPFKMNYNKSSFPFKNDEGKDASERLNNVKISKESYKSNKANLDGKGERDLDMDNFMREKGFTEKQLDLVGKSKKNYFNKNKQAMSDTVNTYKYQNPPKIKK